MLSEGQSLESIVKSLYDDVKILESREVKFSCQCSRERMLAALTTLDVQDLKEMIKEDHGCEINCQFCGNSYQFNEAELQNIVVGKDN